MDRFYEQLLTTSKNTLYKFYNFLMYFSIAFSIIYFFVAIFLFNIFYFVITLTALILSLLFRFLRDNQYKEYEYIFTNGNLQIDVIYNKSKRKTLIDEDVKNFDAFGKKEEIDVSKDFKRICCIPKDYNGDIYIFKLKGKRAVYISPNQEMLKLINEYKRK